MASASVACEPLTRIAPDTLITLLDEPKFTLSVGFEVALALPLPTETNPPPEAFIVPSESVKPVAWTVRLEAPIAPAMPTLPRNEVVVVPVAFGYASPTSTRTNAPPALFSWAREVLTDAEVTRMFWPG